MRGYADMVTQLGGMGSSTPEVTRANREAIRAETEQREQTERREQERVEREREAERRRIRDEVRREEEMRRAAAAPSMATRRLQAPAVLRSAPDGAVIRPLAAETVVFPTGKVEGDWVEVLDADDNIGWLQGERLSR